MATAPAAASVGKEHVDAIRKAHDTVMSEVRKVIIGQDAVVEDVLSCFFAGGHCLITGVPGLAKTLLISSLGKALKLGFKRIQFTPDLMPSDIVGHEILDEEGGKRKLTFVPGPIFSNIVLVDEINRAPAKTQSALFEVMEERQVTVDGVTHPAGVPFMIVATQNPIEHEGTYRLPEAQLDRFLFKIDMGHPSVEEEEQLLLRAQEGLHRLEVDQIKPVITPEEL
ncbi:MAG: AAA family ATPase, partial [Planctomycetota bacterium]|nr:AAA family ATPase [Planctomycetota bacterium]